MKTKEATKGKKRKKKTTKPKQQNTSTVFLLRKSPQPVSSLKYVMLTVTFVHVNAACKSARALMVVLTIPVYLHRPGGSSQFSYQGEESACCHPGSVCLEWNYIVRKPLLSGKALPARNTTSLSIK